MPTISNLNSELTVEENTLAQASDEQLRAVVYDGAELPGVGGIGKVTQVARGAKQKGLLDSTESDVDLVIGVLVGVEAALFVAEKTIDFIEEIDAEDIEGFLEHLSPENLYNLAQDGIKRITGVVGDGFTSIGESLGLIDEPNSLNLFPEFGDAAEGQFSAVAPSGLDGPITLPAAEAEASAAADGGMFDGIDKGQLSKIASVGLSVGAGFLLSTKEGQLVVASALQTIRIIQKIKQAKEIAEKAFQTLTRLA